MFIRNRHSLFVLLVAVVAIAAFLGMLLPHSSSGSSTRIRRTILLKFKPQASPAEVQKILREVKDNISGIKGVRNVMVGRQTVESTAFGYGISMDFDDEAALKRYRADEGHRDTHNKYTHLIEQAQIADIRDE